MVMQLLTLTHTQSILADSGRETHTEVPIFVIISLLVGHFFLPATFRSFSMIYMWSNSSESPTSTGASRVGKHHCDYYYSAWDSLCEGENEGARGHSSLCWNQSFGGLWERHTDDHSFTCVLSLLLSYSTPPPPPPHPAHPQNWN